VSADRPTAGRADGGGLFEVHLVGLSISTYREASEHSDELQREFRLIANQAADGGDPDVPARLLALIDDLNSRFGSFGAGPQARLDAALDAGDDRIDLTYVVPVEVVAAADRLEVLLEEADEYCRAGQQLLTLATPPHALAFRRWFLGEFRRQHDGASPTPWSEPETAEQRVG
jgi:hypothetical protein